MPILNGLESTEQIRLFENETRPELTRVSQQLNQRIPIFAVSASLLENERDKLYAHGMDGWILKPIDFKRLRVVLKGIIDPEQRERDVYTTGCNWEAGGWLKERGARPAARHRRNEPKSSAS
jgi:CheY-like chemotaxis protein